jgi:hypothetical protein
MMNFRMADETMIRQEEEIGIVVLQTRKSIKRDTIHGHQDRGREQQLFVEGNPVDTMVIGHDSLN